MKLAYCDDALAGSVCCRVETSDDSHRRKLYVVCLGCVPQYQRLGIGSLMLEHVIEACRNQLNIDIIYLHVQVDNSPAIGLYEKYGFMITETLSNYFTRLQPSQAYVLTRLIRSDEKKVSM